jgi:hypothetical protein
LLEQDGEKKEEEEAKQRAACKNKTFEEFLRKQNLTENLVHFVVYAIAMVRPDTPAEEGLLQTRCVPSPTVSCSVGGSQYILVRIRIRFRSADPLSDLTPFFSNFKGDAKKLFLLHIFFL